MWFPLVLAGCVSGFATAPELEKAHRWWIFLGQSAAIRTADWRAAGQQADLVVSTDNAQLVPARSSNGPLHLVYLSVGEAEMSRWYWRKVRGRAFLVEINPDWEKSVRVDIRDKAWRDILFEEEVPRLLALGYQGFMLDTLDTPLYLEAREPARFAGSRRALAQFVREIRKKFPHIVLLANGTEALAEVAPYVDGYVTESLFATYDSPNQGYRRTTVAERTWRVAQVNAALSRVWRPVFSIEYASDNALSDWAIRESLKHGFRPYVTNRNVDRLPISQSRSLYRALTSVDR